MCLFAMIKNSPLRRYELTGNEYTIQRQHYCKQNHSSRQSCCVATSHRHVYFLSLFVRLCVMLVRKVGSAATGKVKTFTDTVLGLFVIS